MRPLDCTHLCNTTPYARCRMSESQAKEYSSLRVEKQAIEAARDAKHDSETWSEFILRCSETPPEVVELVEVRDIEDRLDGRDVDEDVVNRLGSQIEIAVNRAVKDAFEEVLG